MNRTKTTQTRAALLAVLLADPWGKWAYDRFTSGIEGRKELFAEMIRLGTVERREPFRSPEAARTVWKEFLATADAYNQPGRFTTLTGFEWSSTPKGDNLHRIVLFADGADKTSQVLPFSMFDSENPEDLWKFLAAYEARTGGRAISPAHAGRGRLRSRRSSPPPPKGRLINTAMPWLAARGKITRSASRSSSE